MMKIHDLTATFEREAEILDASDDGIICAVDGRGEQGNICSLYHIPPQAGKTQKLLTLPGTRIYESFNTYKMCDRWFYAVSVDDQYRVTLKTIDKQDFSIRKISQILPEKEVLQIFPVDEDHLIVVEEGPVSYIWKLSTGRKYDLGKTFGGLYILDAHLWHAGSSEAFLTIHFTDDKNETVVSAGAAALVDAAIQGQKVRMKNLAGPAASIENGGTSSDGIWLHVTEKRNDRSLKIYNFDCIGPEPVQSVCRMITVPEKGTVVKSSIGGHVWQVCEDAENDVVSVKNLSGTAEDFDYPADDGDFNGCCFDGLALTTRYDTVMFRGEPLFSEVVVIRDLKNNAVRTFKGSYEVFLGHLVLKKSFLYL